MRSSRDDRWDGCQMDNMEVFEPISLVAALGEEAALAPSHTTSAPPTRFSSAAKAEWYTAPETVRAEVSRMEREFKAGFAKYKTAAARDAGLAEFHELATKGRTTVKEALSRY